MGTPEPHPWRQRALWLLAGALALLLMAVQVLWMRLDAGIGPPPDSEHHLLLSQVFARAFSLGSALDLWDSLRHSPTQWPPLTYLVYGLFGGLFGHDIYAIRATGVLLLPLLAWGVFILGRALVPGRRGRGVGLLAALLSLASLGVAGQMRQISPDYPAAIAVVWSLVSMLYCREFTRLLPSILFGAAVGVCLLARTQALFFLVGPALWVIAGSLWRSPDWSARLRRVGRMVAGLGALLLTSAPWWAGHLGTFWSHIRDHAGQTDTPVWGDPTFVGGSIQIWGYLGQSTAWLPLICAGLTLPLLLRRGGWKTAALPLLWVVVSVGLYAATVSRDVHYIVPAVPAVMLLAAMGLVRLPPKLMGPLGAALLLWVVGMNLVHASGLLHPGGDEGNDPLVKLARAKVLPYAYVRPLDRLPVASKLVAAMSPALTRELGGPNGRGYILMVHDRRVCMLPRAAALVLPRFPKLLLSDNNHDLRFTRLHRRLRQSGPMLLLSPQRKPDLPLLWSGKPEESQVPVTYYLQRVPLGHPIRTKGVDWDQRRR